ncbi:uroporphyrinogen-III C-methyltransferase [Paenibacillus sp. 481]|uniref:uroporphyrinogen-III C-methyltransferase n=1 Tax=Paenibacillus sp. 481 TaxID=2835869 RepID=UPI001E5739EC|nr:uroporphyrinogen-III C-methyltransferase [Paenibacillus sp. 481]UHA74370.1 uroporphyrinogen-III C-methyltransferase [Paenibacillus sp. 481]
MGERASRVGKVYLVGAGPGDAGLITVKGLRCVQEADVLVYDRLAGYRLIQMAKPSAKKIYVGKLPDRHALKQADINQLLVDLANEGLIVTRLKGGDPCVFGRGAEEAARLKEHDIPFEIVPGVTSAIAVPAYAGIPVTHRDLSPSFSVITGHETPDKSDERVEWDKLAQATGTLLFLMGVAKLRHICDQLIRNGRSADTPVAVIRWGTRAEQRTIEGTLASIADEAERQQIGSPAVIVVGDVVTARSYMQWAEHRPLFGRRILVTRARSQASDFVRRIEELGGEPYEFPVIEMRAPEAPHKLQAIEQALSQLSSYDWVVLTSVNGVQYWFEHLRRYGADIRQLARTRIVAVGPKTAEELHIHGIVPDLVAEQFSQEGVWSKMQEYVVAGQRALLAHGDLARPWLKEQLVQSGVVVEEIDIYETILPEQHDSDLLELLTQNMIHIVTFTSSSTVTNLIIALQRMGIDRPAEYLAGASIACIGEVTARTAREAGLQVDIVAEQATLEGLLDALQHLHT